MTVNDFTREVRVLVRKAIESEINVDLVINELMDIRDVLCGEPDAPTVTKKQLGY